MLAVALSRREAVFAVDRLVAARLERNFRYAAALTAGRLEHLTALAAAAAVATAAAFAAAGFASGTAIGAAVGLIGEALLREKLLFTRGECERLSAIDAVQHFICVHGKSLSYVRFFVMDPTRQYYLERKPLNFENR
jgi:hypothetical protein